MADWLKVYKEINMNITMVTGGGLLFFLIREEIVVTD